MILTFVLILITIFTKELPGENCNQNTNICGQLKILCQADICRKLITIKFRLRKILDSNDKKNIGHVSVRDKEC